ncbi:MAG: SGNH/GDSL hydrolase family protein [Bacteroidales bacterium]|nr:SGNH/GDSL hydrolase family protein [Bacteroidales bacterium]
MKHIFRALLFLAAILPATCTRAQTAGDSLRILWIGNSYTYVNDLPDMVTRLAGEQGLKLAPTRFLAGGARLQDHYRNAKVVDALRKGGWDYIVMQEQSSNPAQATRDVIADTYHYAKLLCDMAKEYSPQGHILMYMTWGHKNGNMQEHEQTDADYPLDETYENFQSRIITTYVEMAYENKTWCAPVGMAWREVRRQHPEIELYTPDESHPSLKGTYLAAQTILATILQKPFVSKISFDGIPMVEAYILTTTAQRTVLGNLHLLGIAPKQKSR